MISKEEWKVFVDRGEIQERIEKHITSVLTELFVLYGGKLSTWYYPGAEEGGMGEMRFNEESISIETETASGHDITGEIEYRDEKYYGAITCDFPIHFLFMSVEDIKKKVSKYKTAQEKALAAEQKKKKASAKAKKTEKQKLINSAKKKLTSDELEALGVK